MNDTKKVLSIVGTMALAVGAAWAVASLFNSGCVDSIPASFCFAVALGAGLGCAWLIQRVRRHLTANTILGIVICVSLVLGLCHGLMYAIHYFATYTFPMITSFPWYYGFSYAEYFVRPVVVICGIAWAVLHIGEDRRNVRDIRLLMTLILISTAVYAVMTVSRRNGLWRVQIFFMYALLLGLEGGALWLLKRWEDNLRSGGAFDLPPKKKKLPPPAPRFWKLGDLVIVVLPLAVIGILMICLLDTCHIWYNLSAVMGNALSVCLLFVMAAWVTAHHYGTRQKLRQLLLINGGAILLTIAAGIVWAVWFNDKEIYPLTGLRADTAVHLGIAYFAPFVLGEILSLILIFRLQKRLSPEKEPTAPAWKAVLAVLSLLFGLGMWGMVADTEYHHEVECDITQIIAYDESEHYRMHLELHIHPVVYIGGTTYQEPDRQEGNALYISQSARWCPFDELKFFLHDYFAYPQEEVTEIYIQKAPGVYALAAVKDAETGQWQLVGES